MTENNKINALPLESLSALGFDKDKLASMPEEVKKPLLEGKITPLLQAHVRLGIDPKTNKEVAITFPVKLQVLRDKEGKARLVMSLVKRELKNELGLNEPQMEALKKGDIISHILVENGVAKRHLLQLDPELNSVIKMDPAKFQMEKCLREFEKVNDITLGQEQRQRVKEGKPVELSVGDQPVTVGLDLRTPEGIRFLQNDLNEWERRKMIEYDRAHPEVMGYIHTDENRWEFQQLIDKKKAENSIHQGVENDTKRSSSLKI